MVPGAQPLHGRSLMNRNAIMNRHKMLLSEAWSSRKPVLCKFCGCDSLFVCGTERNTYLGCGNCGADGPEASGISGAVSAYTRLEREGVLEWKL